MLMSDKRDARNKAVTENYFRLYTMNGVFYDTSTIKRPKNENPLSFGGSVLSLPEAFGSFLTRRSMCSIWICSEAACPQSSLMSCQSAKQRRTSRPKVQSCLFSGFCTIPFSLLPNNMLLTFYFILNAAQKEKDPMSLLLFIVLINWNLQAIID